ncbi:MAG TPA: nitrilase-related carbon-nitrogen hydrolase, partial [Edaphobacter sp.]|nr:nitrilase-related carbon-nitrogen hydrolase [Edaphobacter sp.]
MKIALAQINPTVGDFTGNTKKILEFATRAAEQGVGLVVFPELCVCGYPPADFLEKSAFVERAVQAVDEIAAWTGTPGRPALLVGSVMPAASQVGKRVSNAAILLADGKRAFVQQKMLLPFYDVFDEQRYFEPAASQSLTFVGDQPVAITICEDAWNDKDFWPRQLYPVDPVNALMQQ